MPTIDVRCDNGQARHDAIFYMERKNNKSAAVVIEDAYFGLAAMKIKVLPDSLKVDHKMHCVVGRAEVIEEHLPPSDARNIAFAKSMGYPVPPPRPV